LINEIIIAKAFFNSYKNELAVLIVATLAMALSKYHPLQSDWVSSSIYFLVLPICSIIILFRKNPLYFGLRFGNIKIWGVYVLITCIVLIPVLYISSRLPAFQSYYRIESFSFIRYLMQNIIYLLGWEYIFRGFLLFGFKDKFNEGSILLQMVPFVIMHLGKPELETISTLITGVYFGYVCYRGNSYWPAYLIHLFINVSFVSIINFGW
jgi:uncharacterized protein